ncbi:MAG: FG-GAP-like repeat-containing protein [Candidatus Heimdallarchaeaceae archaeon]
MQQNKLAFLMVTVTILIIAESNPLSYTFLNPTLVFSNIKNAAQSPSLSVKWIFSTNWIIDSSPAVADVDGDGQMEILLTSKDRNLYCLSYEGQIEWVFTAGSSIVSSPAVADLDRDGKVEIVFGCDDGKIYCVSDKGTLEWAYQTSRPIYSSPTLADIDNDGFFEVLIGSEDHRLYCLDYKGRQKWNYTTGSAVFSTPCVADLDQDGKLEIAFGSWDDYFYCLNATGGLSWKFFVKGVITSSPAVADLDQDGKLEIVFGSWNNNTYCLNNEGELQWNYTTNDVSSSPAIGDLDNNGHLEVVIGTGYKNHSLYCISNGTIKWAFTRGGEGFAESPSLVNLDYDNTLEVLIGSINDVGSVGSNYYYLDHNGQIQDTFKTTGSSYATSCIADLDGDGTLEILVGTDDIVGEHGFLYCLTLSQSINGISAPWPCFMGSVYHTGWMDSDGDYLDDLTESFYQTNSSKEDTDGDEFLDGWEVQVGLNPLVDDARQDKDGDGLTNYEEAKIYHTSLFTADTDNDGLLDGWEVENGYNPLKWDNWGRLLGLYLLPLWIVVPVLLYVLFYRHLPPKYRILKK